MERFLHLSLGSQVGASGVALIAVLEMKRLLQYPVGFQGPSKASACIVRLTAEEWRTVAGIHERKTFERAKAKLEALEVLRIERNGKLLEITLWPDPVQVEDDLALCDQEVEAMCTSTSIEVDTHTEGPTQSSGVPYEASGQTSWETSKDSELEAKIGTGYGTHRGTSLELAARSEPGTGLLRERVLRSREDVVFPRPDVPKNGYYPTKLDNNSLLRYPLTSSSLTRSSLTNIKCINNANNETTNNDQRYNVRQEELKFANLWVQEVGHPLTPYEQEGLSLFTRLGYTAELFVEALRCAVAADNRQMGYVLGILRNWYQEGVRCLQDVAEVRKQWEDLRFIKRAKPCKV